jgi:hypothetical protein
MPPLSENGSMFSGLTERWRELEDISVRFMWADRTAQVITKEPNGPYK